MTLDWRQKCALRRPHTPSQQHFALAFLRLMWKCDRSNRSDCHLVHMPGCHDWRLSHRRKCFRRPLHPPNNTDNVRTMLDFVSMCLLAHWCRHPKLQYPHGHKHRPPHIQPQSKQYFATSVSLLVCVFVLVEPEEYQLTAIPRGHCFKYESNVHDNNACLSHAMARTERSAP